ncbi:type IV pilin protein [Agarivorans albus]|uniref:Type IV pilus biogenesis protein PilE n=1 Tax=Agarivorans albus MKT 106 TaxID=1331007 RepID=R9PTI6_AGAAL|nr:type IV pilin protein [Agarivorans albus]GAD02486.1 type IV pilus biogenesis protein PilE [Agarivorans albus MKT 106]
MKQLKGFTLVEVMITVAIVAILAGIAYPSYLSHVQTTRREEGKRTLVEAAQYMESYYAMHLSYVGAATGTTLSIYNTSSDFDEIYTLKVSSVDKSSYTLEASPKGAQAGDSCGELSITSKGTTSAGTTGCW